ncbi:MAG: hypothetical protein U0X20_04275 [Caldilineaceae bacterium]
MRGPQFEHHLVLLAQVNCLHIFALAQVPEVQPVAVAPVDRLLQLEAVRKLVRLAPLAGGHDVLREVPPEVVAQFLAAAVDFPCPQHVEVEVVEHGDSRRTTVEGT